LKTALESDRKVCWGLNKISRASDKMAVETAIYACIYHNQITPSAVGELDTTRTTPAAERSQSTAPPSHSPSSPPAHLLMVSSTSGRGLAGFRARWAMHYKTQGAKHRQRSQPATCSIMNEHLPGQAGRNKLWGMEVKDTVDCIFVL